MSSHLILLFTSDFYNLPPALQQKAYHEYYKLVYPLIYFIIKDHGATEDIIQESFLRSIKKASQLQDLEKLEGWLKTLARNVTLNYLKKFSRNREELDFLDIFPETDAPSRQKQADPAESVDNQVEIRMMKEAINRYLDQLRPEYRQLIEMRWIHSLSYKEIAAALDTSEGAVRQKLFRAREAIKFRFQQEWGPHDES